MPAKRNGFWAEYGYLLVTVVVVFVLFREPLAAIFTENGEVIALSAQLMVLIAIYQFSDAIQGLSISMLRGLQDVKVIMPIVLVSYLGLNIPIGCWLAYGMDMGCHGLVTGLIVGLTSAAVMTFIRLRRHVV
jgi:MATE family multidrug resistance protein